MRGNGKLILVLWAVVALVLGLGSPAGGSSVAAGSIYDGASFMPVEVVATLPFTYDAGATSQHSVRVEAAEAIPAPTASSVEARVMRLDSSETTRTRLRPIVDLVAPSGALDDLAAAACRTNSFAPGTEVLMADGTNKPIEKIETGDWVRATDPETGERGPLQVVDTIVGDGDKQLVDIEVVGDTITATDGHPFWVDDEGRWVEAGHLEAGDHLLLADSSTVLVSAVSGRLVAGRVHNLTVEGIHTYFVEAGDDAVLVHNCTIADNIHGEMTDRGWTEDIVDEVVDKPTFTHNVWDLTTDSAATAYARGDNYYVVVNDATG